MLMANKMEVKCLFVVAIRENDSRQRANLNSFRTGHASNVHQTIMEAGERKLFFSCMLMPIELFLMKC